MTKPKIHNKYHNTASDDAVYIGRGTPFGNPFILGIHGNREEVCAKYRKHLLSNKNLISLVKLELKGKDLVCFCSPKQCHGDILLEVAND